MVNTKMSVLVSSSIASMDKLLFTVPHYNLDCLRVFVVTGSISKKVKLVNVNAVASAIENAERVWAHICSATIVGLAGLKLSSSRNAKAKIGLRRVLGVDLRVPSRL